MNLTGGILRRAKLAYKYQYANGVSADVSGLRTGSGVRAEGAECNSLGQRPRFSDGNIT